MKVLKRVERAYREGTDAAHQERLARRIEHEFARGATHIVELGPFLSVVASSIRGVNDSYTPKGVLERSAYSLGKLSRR